MYARTMKTLVLTSLLTVALGSATTAQSSTMARPHGGWLHNPVTIDLSTDALGTDARMRIGADPGGILPDDPFVVFAGDSDTGTPLAVLYVGTVPPAGDLPVALPLHAIQAPGIALYVATRVKTFRVDPVLEDDDGVVISCPKGPFFGHYGPVPTGPEIVVTIDPDRGVRVRTAADADGAKVGPTMIQATTATGDPAKRDDDGDVISCPKGPFLTDYGPVAEGPGDVVTTDPGRRVRTAADADGAKVGPTMIQ